MQICMIIYTHLAYTKMTEMLYVGHFELFNELKWSISSIHIAIYYHKIEFVYYTFVRYRVMFNFIWQCTRLLPNKVHSLNVKYIIDYKVKFLRYTQTYSLS